MRIVTILLCFVSLTFSQSNLNEQDLGQFSNNERLCLKDLGTDEQMVTKALQQLYMPEDNPQFNEFMECSWNRDGFIDYDGSIVFDRFRHFVRGAHMDAVGIPELAEVFADDTIGHCKDVQGDTPGQTGVKLMNCILKRLFV